MSNKNIISNNQILDINFSCTMINNAVTALEEKINNLPSELKSTMLADLLIIQMNKDDIMEIGVSFSIPTNKTDKDSYYVKKWEALKERIKNVVAKTKEVNHGT